MRKRLVYALAAWLLAAVAVSVLALASFSAWNLREGFTAYLQARDVERFERFLRLVESRLASRAEPIKGLDVLDMRALLRDLALQEGERPVTPPPLRRPPDGAMQPGPDFDGPARPGRAPHLPPLSGEGFGARVGMTHADGRPWAGSPPDEGRTVVAQRELRVGGQVVAQARLYALTVASESMERQFLRSQYLGIGGIALGLLVLAGSVAVWLSRQWVRPLKAMQVATARIASGELSARVPVDRVDEIGELARNVNDMASSLERMEGTRRRWLADLSHELRTPLTALQGEIEALADGIRPFNVAAIGSLRDDVRRLTVLVNDLHLLSMADLNSLPCHWAEDDASQTIVRVLERAKLRAGEKGLTLTWPAACAAPLKVVWDATRIEQLLDNLLQNSTRYTEAPGVIEVAWRSQGDTLVLTVDDSPPGVPARDLPRLFEALYRADFARQRERGGSGLGLAICAAIVDAHGGRIEAVPSPRGGLRINVELPLVAERKESV